MSLLHDNWCFKSSRNACKRYNDPRSEMVIIEKDSHIENFLPMIIKSTHSRFPVILDNKDEVIGILLAKDILPYANNTDDFKIDDILRPAVIIPESKD